MLKFICSFSIIYKKGEIFVMQMLEMLYDEIQDAVDRKVPFVIPIGTLEYHARHASCGTDTLVINGCLRELEKENNLILEAAHPSPLSAYNGFFGCKHFSKTNEFLIKHGITPIDWDLTK